MAKVKDRSYLSSVVSLGCVVCRNLGYGETPANVHHIRLGQGMSQRASDYLTIPLCHEHHQHGGPGVAIHAGQEQWEVLYGTELELLAQTIGDIFKCK